MSPRPPTDRHLQRAAALARWALATDEDRRAQGGPGQRGLQARFEQAVDEALPGLSPEERARRVAALRSAYFSKLVGERQRRARERARAEQKAAEPPRPLHPRFHRAIEAAFGEELGK